MDLLFLLNGSYEDIARAEALELLSSCGARPTVTFASGQLLAVSCAQVPADTLSRLALSHVVLSALGSVEVGSGELDPARLRAALPSGSFCVRVKKVDKDINAMAEERRLSDQIITATGATVNLAAPDRHIIGIHVGGMIHMGLVVAASPARDLQARKPQHRPFFHPSSLDPRLARALVNISGATSEVLDPFCGTGGILIEAGLMGLAPYGIDIEEKMVEGCRRNLAHYGVVGTVVLGDATDIGAAYGRSFESVVTDVPYGKSTVIGGQRDSLYASAFSEIRGHCRSRAVIVVPQSYDFASLGFTEKYHFVIRVHKSLDRHIYVLVP